MTLNLKVYLNILLVIFIVSLILHNVGSLGVLGRTVGLRGVEKFSERLRESGGESSGESGGESGGDMRSELERYAEELAGDEEEEKQSVEKKEIVKASEAIDTQPVTEKFGNMEFPQMPVKPGNFFGVNEGSANFNSNVMDINKFYKNSFGDIEFRTPYTGGAGKEQLSAKQVRSIEGAMDSVNGVGGGYVNHKSSDGTATYKPDMWQYKGENVMNGGELFGGVSGFDGLDNGLAMYSGLGGGMLTGKCNGGDMSGCGMGKDDLRMGMGRPGRYQRNTE